VIGLVTAPVAPTALVASSALVAPSGSTTHPTQQTDRTDPR